MRNQFRFENRTLSFLDSASSPSDLGQDYVPATPGHPNAAAASGTPPADAALSSSPAHVLVFIHAFPMNAAMWEAQVASPPPGWRFLAIDLRGFGQSENDTVGTARHTAPAIDDYARDVLALLDHVGVFDAVVGGLSMGGYTAFALARLAPARIRGFILSNTRAEADDEAGKKGRQDTLALLDRGGVAAVAAEMLPRVLGDTTLRGRPGIVERVRALIESNSAEGIRQGILRMMNRPDSTPLLSTIARPTLVIASDEDRAASGGQAHVMHRGLANADLVTIRRAGHLSNVEQPEQFNDAVHRFLSTHFGD